MTLAKITDFNLRNQRVLIRADLNVPMTADGVISSDARIIAALPTIKFAVDSGARVILSSHLGRPKEGVFEEKFSLKAIAKRLEELLNLSVNLRAMSQDSDMTISNDELVMLENVRFNKGEKSNDQVLSKKMAALCDVFVMDAFGTAHRKHASTFGVAQFAPQVCAGLLMMQELENLTKIVSDPARPLVAVVGGAKVSTKLSVLQALSDKCDQIIPGGGIANTFLAAAGFSVGSSLYEKDLIEQARFIMDTAEIILPEDVIVAKTFLPDAEVCLKSVTQVSEDDMILDVGPVSQSRYARYLAGAQTILWNGPVGVFEFDSCAAGTKALAEAIARSRAFSIAGGGDTVAAVDKFHVRKAISYISTGGGAFLEYVEGKKLPAVKVLEERAILSEIF